MGYIIAFGKTLLVQLIGIFGIFFVIGFILLKLQERTHKNYVKSVGWKGILWTAWIGTPIHELGHAFFAVVFNHTVKNITLFSPNKETGGLGNVEHGYDRRSIYQNIGNFFVGAAPMIFGSFILLILFFVLVPSSAEMINISAYESQDILLIFTSIGKTFLSLFSIENFLSWQFWIFLYLSLAISAHMAPSKVDRIGMCKGFIWIVGILSIVNFIALGLGQDITSYILSVNQYLGVLVAILLFAMLISVVHMLLSYILVKIIKKRAVISDI